MRSEKRCNQCWQVKPLVEFWSDRRQRHLQDCGACRGLYRGGGRRATRRAALDEPGPTLVAVVRRSGNAKLGPIPATITTGNTCPDACGLRDSGCFAEFGVSGHHWRKARERGKAWGDFLQWVRDLPEGQVWRHNVAGDLPGERDDLDPLALAQLVEANAGRRGFTYTHKPIRDRGRVALVAYANRMGFTVNLSADGLEDADRKAALGCAPVAVVLPEDAPERLATPGGRRVIVCPAETRGVNCARCRLCADPKRATMIGFRAHGQWKERVNQIVQLRRRVA